MPYLDDTYIDLDGQKRAPRIMSLSSKGDQMLRDNYLPPTTVRVGQDASLEEEASTNNGFLNR